MRPSDVFPLIFAFAGALCACTGSIADPGKTPPEKLANPPGGAGAASGAKSACSPAKDVGVTPLRRLTRAEYNNTVRDLLGDATRPANGFAPDETLLGFAAGLYVSPTLLDQYVEASEKLATTAAANLPKLLDCNPATAGEDACAHGFIDAFGARAYRRPLADDQRAALRALYAKNKTDFGFAKSIELLVTAFLQSPEFLYRMETGAPAATPGLVALDAYELATRLSYLYWGTMPDPALFAAAADGSLNTPAGLDAQVRRILGDARIKGAVDSFHDQWLALEELERSAKDGTLYPGWTDALKDALRDETLRFAEHVVLEGDGAMKTLLTAPFTFASGAIAQKIYGRADVTASAPIARLELPATERAGLLTQPSLLALHAKHNQSSPVHRGKFVREQLLCQQLQPPPANLVIEAPELDPNLPTRERFAEHDRNPACAACHALIDPIGFGFEHYDAIGRWRATDGPRAVDATGNIVESETLAGPFDGAIELAHRLAGSPEVASCLASHWFVFAFGRSMANTNDACSRERLIDAFARSQHNLRDLLAALPSLDAFHYRRAALPAGGTP